MDCLVCKTRSAVESCAVCHTLLCEVCAAKCEMCGKMVCPQHVHKTHSGRNVCFPCQEKRVAARRAREAGAAQPEQDAAAAAAAGAQEQEAEWEVLTESVRKPPPPWKLSLYVACAGVVLAILLFIFPGLCRIVLPGGRYLPTSFVLLIIPAMALFWGVVGLLGKQKEYEEGRSRCYIGMGVSVLAAALLIGAFFADPARRAEAEAARMQNERLNMTPDQLKQWREGVFQKYQQ